jgi:alpha-L-rhamnosidase
MQVISLRTNTQLDPLGIDSTCPEFSWKIGEVPAGWRQSGYALQVALDEDFERMVWDSGRIGGDRPYGVVYGGLPLQSCQRYVWRVRVWDEAGLASAWSELATFETAYLDTEQLQANWIGLPVRAAVDERAALYLRHVLELPAAVVKGRAYASALGWYRLFVNRQNLTGSALVPRWTPLDQVVEYQTYDVTQCFHEGSNVIAMAVGDGRYRGKLGATSRRAVYGERLAGFVRIELELANGEHLVVTSNSLWEAGTGRIVRADPQDGECADLRLSDDDWLTSTARLPGFCTAEPFKSHRRLIAEEVGRVDEVASLRPVRISRAPSGRQLVDFGQNFAGVVSIKLSGPIGARVQLTYSELLDPSGELDTAYLKLPLFPAVLQRDEVILGAEACRYQPWFTSHGFRYLEVDGLDRDLLPEDVEGIVLSSRLEEGGHFECSDARLNRLHQNVLWSLRSNFVDTPSDCPTRERSGWTGDIQVFADTAAKFTDVQAYLRRYLANLTLEQLPDGRIPPFIPSECSTFSGGMPRLEFIHASSAGWGDVAILLPWSLYRSYGDREVLQRQYPSMQRWLNFLVELAEKRRGHSRWFAKRVGKLERYIVDGGFHFGEWLRPGDGIAQILRAWLVPEARVATAYLASSARLLGDIAELLGRNADAAGYRELACNVREAWRAAFIRTDGRIGQDRQDDYVRALAFDLLDVHEQPAAVERLVALIEANDHHLDTGFLSTPMLLPTLARHGRADVAYRLLLQTTNPSWLGQIERGATTVWETWEGYRPDGKAKMSHNHYAFGAVAGWLYEGIAGISALEAGYRRIRIAPCVGGGLSHAAATLNTPYGVARSAWRLQGDEVHLDVTIPPGSEADVHLADGRIERVGSGQHGFIWKVPAPGSAAAGATAVCSVV